jgi:hypothetical protein
MSTPVNPETLQQFQGDEKAQSQQYLDLLNMIHSVDNGNEKDNIEEVERILDSFQQPSDVVNDHNVFMHASRHLSILELLPRYGLRPETFKTPVSRSDNILFFSLQESDLATFEWVLQHADRDIVSETDEIGFGILFRAVQAGKPEFVDDLLHYMSKQDIEDEDDGNESPLSMAIIIGNEDIVDLFLKNETIDKSFFKLESGGSILHCAIQYAEHHILEKLVGHRHIPFEFLEKLLHECTQIRAHDFHTLCEETSDLNESIRILDDEITRRRVLTIFPSRNVNLWPKIATPSDHHIDSATSSHDSTTSSHPVHGTDARSNGLINCFGSKLFEPQLLRIIREYASRPNSSDEDQGASDEDQDASDEDQYASDEDQDASDEDQYASDEA